MGDVICKVCGEPWEFYYIMHEMEAPWNKKVLYGLGCPSCKGKSPDGKDRTLEHALSLDNTDLDPFEFI